MRLCRLKTTRLVLLLFLSVLLSLPTWALSDGHKSAKTTETKLDDDGATTTTSGSTKKKKRRNLSSSTTAGASANASGGCRGFAFQQKYNRDANMAYRMAALSSLVYLQFHKQQQQDWIDFRLVGTRRSLFKLLQCRLQRSLEQYMRPFLVGGGHASESKKNHETSKDDGDSDSDSDGDGDPPQRTSIREHPSPSSCREKATVRKREHSRHRVILRYWLYDWHEPTAVPGVHYHDTDLLVATSADDRQLLLTFAGTASAADHATNLQTFERSNHSSFFHGGNKEHLVSNNQTNITIIEGSLHRGFLNAYSRVERGSVLALTLTNKINNSTTTNSTAKSIRSSSSSRLTKSLDRRFGDCTAAQSTRKKRRGCRSRNERLITILREVVKEALQAGKTVHLSGHSLGGGIATMMGLDIVINFPEIPVHKLHLWTFGAPQVADEIFLQSAMAAAPRLQSFVEKRGNNGRYHRYVTLSDRCKVDIVSTIAASALPAHSRKLRGRAVRRFGGLRGAIVHLAEPHYLLTPEQFKNHNAKGTNNSTRENSSAADGASSLSNTSTRSSFHAHATNNYLQGVSRESREHPLSTDLPQDLRLWMGEAL